jgi:hypothetical protein
MKFLAYLDQSGKVNLLPVTDYSDDTIRRLKEDMFKAYPHINYILIIKEPNKTAAMQTADKKFDDIAVRGAA